MHSKDLVATRIVIHLARRLWFSLHPSKQDGLLGTCSMLTSFKLDLRDKIKSVNGAFDLCPWTC
jgi:hypothetical protein